MIFWPKSPFYYLVSLFIFYWNKWFSHLFCFLFCDFIVIVRRWFVCYLCAALFVFLVSFKYLFGSDCQIRFDLVQIQSMTLASSMLQIPRHGYSGDLNILIYVDFCTLPFYATNMDVVSLFADSSFLVLANLHCIDVLYQFEWMNIIYFCKKKSTHKALVSISLKLKYELY